MKFKPNPIEKTAIILILLSTMALVRNLQPETFLGLGTTLGFALVLFALYTRFSSKRKVLANTVVTGLILFLLIQPIGFGVNIWAPLAATFIAITLKFFVEFKGSPIVNPAAFALLGVAIIAKLVGNDAFIVSWWGASFGGWISFVPLAIWALRGIHAWRKWPLVLSFLGFMALGLRLLNADPAFIRFAFTDSTLYFFATIMLIEPKSSPIKWSEECVYGAVVGILTATFHSIQLPHFILHAVIAGNLLYYFKTLPLRYTAKSR